MIARLNVATKLSLFFAGLAILMASLLAAALYAYVRAEIRQDLCDRLLDVVAVQALQIDAAAHAAFDEPEDAQTPAYHETQKRLNQIQEKKGNSFRFLGTYRETPDGRVVHAVTGVKNTSEGALPGREYDDDWLEAHIATILKPTVAPNYYHDAHGDWLRGYAPILDADGKQEGVVAIELSIDTAFARKRHLSHLAAAVCSFGVVIFLSIFCGRFLGHAFATPLMELTNAANRVAGGDLEHDAPVKRYDELGDLGRAFNTMTSRLRVTLSQLQEEIAEHRKTIERLQESERKFLEVFHRSDDAILIFDDGIFTDCNESAAQMLHLPNGYEAMQLTPFSVSPEMQPDGANSLEKALEMIALARERGFHRFEWLHKRMDGELFTADVSLTLISLHGREVLYVLWRDITEHKLREEELRRYRGELESLVAQRTQSLAETNNQLQQEIKERTRTEAALRMSEHKYRTLYNNHLDGLVSTDLEGRFTQFNPAFLEMTGYSEEELFEVSYEKLTPPEWYDMERAITRDEVLARGYSRIYEKTYYHKNGTIFPVEVQVYLMCDAENQPKGFWAFVRDITARKAAEKALRASEKRYRDLVQNLPVGIFRAPITPEGGNPVANPAIESMFGASDMGVVLAAGDGRYFHEPSDGVRFLQKLQAERSVVREEVLMQRDIHTPLWASITASIIQDPENHTETIDGIIEDITARKQAELEREKLIGELREALAQVNTLQGLLPICANCKKIRNDQGYWSSIELYISAHSEARFTHSICPECRDLLYPDIPKSKK